MVLVKCSLNNWRETEGEESSNISNKCMKINASCSSRKCCSISSSRNYRKSCKTGVILIIAQLITMVLSAPLKQTPHSFHPLEDDVLDLDVIKGHRWEVHEDGKYIANEKISRPSRSIAGSSRCMKKMVKVAMLGDHVYSLANVNSRRIHHKRNIPDRLQSEAAWGNFYHALHDKLKTVFCQANLVRGVLGRGETEIKMSLESMILVLQELMNRSQRSFTPWSRHLTCEMISTSPFRSKSDLRRTIINQLYVIDRRLQTACDMRQ